MTYRETSESGERRRSRSHPLRRRRIYLESAQPNSSRTSIGRDPQTAPTSLT